jgi:polysaccharide export outer membrane protein
MKRILVIVAILGVLAVPTLVQSQDQQTAPRPGQDFGQPTTIDNLGLKNYLVGPGDVLDVRVFGQPDLNSMVEIDSDGNISSLPFLDPIPAACRPEKEIQKAISSAYAKYLKKAQISVRVAQRNSRPPAVVFGAIRMPTRVQMNRKVRLSELMAVSGGFTERAAGTIQILHTEPLMCPAPGEEELAKPIDWIDVHLKVVRITDLRTNKIEANPIIRPGDYVLVTESEPVYVMGSVIAPQGLYMREHLTLRRAMAMVGGPSKIARISDVRIYRQKPVTGEQQTIHLDYGAIKKGEKPDFQLEAYDIIDVPEAGALSPTRLTQTLLGAVTGGFGAMTSTATTALPLRVLY